MSDGFLARWSLRKQASRTTAGPAAAAPAVTEAPAEDPPVEPAEAVAVETGRDPDDTSRPCGPTDDLPPVEELDAGSDYKAFLRRDVPKAVRAAALRKAWTTDPAIADYRPLADYDWDFNAPGYAALRPTDDPTRFVKALFRHLEEKAPDAADPATTGPVTPDGAPPEAAPVAPGPVGETSEPAVATLDPAAATGTPVEPGAAMADAPAPDDPVRA
ncbi:DUF3306 domain-containing protein [Chthonobacter rhizosphaerae]|uniref:DUF3306 domain-containing protein n=1 Tax=Chthonobacter rhizosphaerae TaxID=2735553 RepID=UPI0015EF9C07|nr:DUF3306 domain-containing protein [Chthonobacter rhizosphaerae]